MSSASAGKLNKVKRHCWVAVHTGLSTIIKSTSQEERKALSTVDQGTSSGVSVHSGEDGLVHDSPPKPGDLTKKGLRAFPPEIREVIFEACFEQGEDPADYTNLAICLYKHDKELYTEVKKVYFDPAYIVLDGNCWEDPRSAVTGNLLHYKDFPLVRKLSINFLITEYSGFDNFKCCFRDFRAHLKDLSLDHVEDITLDFSRSSCQMLWHFSIHVIAQWILKRFQQCKKISVVLMTSLMGQRFPEEEEEEDATEQETSLWYRCWPDPTTQWFEENEIDILATCLGFLPKLKDIRPVSVYTDDEEHRSAFVYFLSQSYDENDTKKSLDLTTWFWEAEEGQNLVWKGWDVYRPITYSGPMSYWGLFHQRPTYWN